MKTKHTPGPWQVSNLADGSLGIKAHNGSDIGNQLVASVAYGNQQDAANARLIAAAPQLLEALQSLVEYWDNGAPVHPGALVVDDVRSAIRAATGEE